MLKVKRSLVLYGISVFTVAIALLLKLLLDPLIDTDRSLYFLFLSAALVSAWYGGIRPGLLATLLSSTEPKQAEEALNKERDFIAVVLNTVRSLVVVLDRQGRIVSFNRACEQTTGYGKRAGSLKALSLQSRDEKRHERIYSPTAF